MGDYLRYAMFDKYFKKIGNCVGPSTCPAGTGKDSEHYLISWYYAWGGSLDTAGGWAWRIGDGASHQGYQNPMAAYALSERRGPEARLGDRRQADWAQEPGPAAGVLPVAAVRRGRASPVVHQQLGRRLRHSAGRALRRSTAWLRPAAGLARPAEQPVVRFPGLVDGAGRGVLLRDR